MVTDKAIEKMVNLYHGNFRDISHFLKVYALAKVIGAQEKLSEDSQEILELSAIVHDISCPLCREKYGDANGKKQELESPPLVEAFFEELPVSAEKVQRISWIVAHHHTYTNVSGIEHQILLEADYLVNAGESSYPESSVLNAQEHIFKTDTGKRLLYSMYIQAINGMSHTGN